jgi:Na+-transporting methylmalonyl-CoA/oxaloacetate decarboxylase gamma subunit
VVIGWLTRVVLTLTVVGIIAFDGLSVLIGRVITADKADSAAQAAAQSYRHQSDPVAAATAAAVSAADATIVPGTLRLGEDGSATVSVHRVARTLVFRYFTPLAKLADITEAGSAPAATE